MNPIFIAKLAVYALSAAAIAGVAFYILSLYNDSKQLDICNANLASHIETIKQNNEATDDYQNQLASLNARLAKRVQPKRCIPVQSTCLPSNSASASGNAKPARGLSSEYVRQVASDIKRTAIYVDACSKWVKQQRKD